MLCNKKMFAYVFAKYWRCLFLCKLLMDDGWPFCTRPFEFLVAVTFLATQRVFYLLDFISRLLDAVLGSLAKFIVIRQSTFILFSAFPNAKVSPPKRGDNDFMMRSNKLNSDKHLLHHLLKSNIDFHWETLWREFTSIDRQGTGNVSRKDFTVSWTMLVSSPSFMAHQVCLVILHSQIEVVMVKCFCYNLKRFLFQPRIRMCHVAWHWLYTLFF